MILDQYLAQEAREQHKVVAGVETVAEQCKALNAIPHTAALNTLNQTLTALEGMRIGSESPILTEVEKMTQDYICGRLGRPVLPTRTSEEVQISKWMNNIMLTKRNKVMASRVIKLLRSNPGSSLFIAFGHHHFTGDDSLTDLMREAGFGVERVRVTDDLNNWESRHSGAAQRRGLSLLIVGVLMFLSLL